MSARAKVIRRMVFYAFMLAYVSVRVAIDNDWISWAVFVTVSVYAIAQLIEDIGELRKMKQNG